MSGMVGKWTFTSAEEENPAWLYDVFDTKEEAKEEGMMLMLGEDLLIGQVGEDGKIINIEEV